MEKHLVVVNKIGTGVPGANDPVRPNITGSYSPILYTATKVICWTYVADGTALPANGIARCLPDPNGGWKVDVELDNITAPQKAVIKTFLTNQGFDVTQFDADSPDDRRKLFQFVIKRLAKFANASNQDVITGFDVA